MANREMLKSVKTVPLLSCPVKQEDLNPTDSTVSKILIVYTEKERKLWTWLRVCLITTVLQLCFSISDFKDKIIKDCQSWDISSERTALFPDMASLQNRGKRFSAGRGRSCGLSCLCSGTGLQFLSCWSQNEGSGRQRTTAGVPLRVFISMLLCLCHIIQGSCARCSCEDALVLCQPATCFWAHTWVLSSAAHRRAERCYMKCMHSIENVLEYSGTVVIIWQLNSDLVFHDELNMNINHSLLSKPFQLFINVLCCPYIFLFWCEED